MWNRGRFLEWTEDHHRPTWLEWYVRTVQPSMVSPEIRSTPLLIPAPQPIDFRFEDRRKREHRVHRKQAIFFPNFNIEYEQWQTDDTGPRESYISRLPPELLCHIFSFLELYDVLPLAAVCRRWKATIRGLLRRRRELDLGDLSFKAQTFVTDDILRRMLPRMPRLRRLTVSGLGPRFLDVNVVSYHCRELETLDLSTYTVSKSAMLRLCRRCPRLADLTLPADTGDALVGMAVQSLRCLRSLKLDGAVISAGGWLAELPPTMESLSLTSCHLEDSAPLKRANMPHLKTLDLSKELYLDWSGMDAALARWSGIERLDLGQSSVPNQLVRKLPELLPQLRELSLNQCPNVTSWGVARLHRLRHLHSLNVVQAWHRASERDGAADAAGLLAALERVTSLSQLTVGDLGTRQARREVQITPAHVQSLLLALPRLETLQVYMQYGKLESGFWRRLEALSPPLKPGRRVEVKLFGVRLKKDITFTGFSKR